MHHRFKYSLLILLFVQLQFRVNAQEQQDAGIVESTSYRLYQQSSWDSLGSYCESAIGHGSDYYYLRMRAGIAYFKKAEYRKAIPHFEKALVFNVNDAYANEYLYFCYTYSGMYEQARWLAKSFDSTFCAAIGAGKLPAVSMVMAEGGPRISNTDAFKTAAYAQAGLSHYVAKRFSLFHALTYYRQDEKRYKIRQYQYYIKAAIPLKHCWQLAAGAQVVFNNTTYNDSVTVFEQVPVGNPGGPGSPPPMTVVERRILKGTVVKSYAYIGAASISKSIAHFDLGAGITGLFSDSLQYYQVNGTIVYYPFATNKLSIGASVYLHSLDQLRMDYVSFSPVVGLNFKKWSLAASYLYNAGNNAIEYTGYLVNNSEDLSPQKMAVLASAVVSKKVQLYGVYSYETKKLAGKNLNYNYNTFILGIRITPY